ncbi:hypothetical protein RB195_015143 [Necator americanus]|uniref:Uncharacterized protein n=1 Tax=Necator americanus TaxID=51031 RepID=A0ABR1E368_NECAM
MNRKEECIAVTNELAPYQNLCGGATLTTGGPLTSRFRGYQGSEEGDDAETALPGDRRSLMRFSNSFTGILRPLCVVTTPFNATIGLLLFPLF